MRKRAKDPIRRTIVVRPCFEQDLQWVQLIYAHHVVAGTGTFETVPPRLDEMQARWTKVVTAGWPYLVASGADDPSRIYGFAYAQPFRDRAAYAWTLEDSIYVAPTAVGGGVGRALMRALLAEAELAGGRQMVAVIGDSANARSIALHAWAGFRHAGTLHAVGWKFGRWLDVVLMQRSLSGREE